LNSWNRHFHSEGKCKKGLWPQVERLANVRYYLTMKFTVLSLFPEIIDAYFAASIASRSLKRGICGYRSVNIRDYAFDRHKTCDDAPYGGGAGMLLLAGPLSSALEAAGAKRKAGCHNLPQTEPESVQTAPESARIAAEGAVLPVPRVIYLSPSGTLFNQKKAESLAREGELILICGRYEGIDQRIIDLYVDEELCVGDYVLSSGEVAALAVIDTVNRLVDAVIKPDSLSEESFTGGLLEYPQWTRPEIFANMKVPEELLSGHHENIRAWRLKRRIEKTLRNRPDMIRHGIENDFFDDETLRLINEAALAAEERL
jgi:tRNA (guanine37-N1)-methyltransferase